jgi:hypothetical protein
MLRVAGIVVIVLSLILAVTVRVEERRVDAAHARAVAAALASSNIAAESDSTREVADVNGAVAGLLGDSLRLVEKRALQLAQRDDALDVAMGAERRARYALETTVDSLQEVVRAQAVPESTHAAWQASFEIRHEPYTVHADVLVPAPPDSARLDMRVQLDSIHVEARVLCAPPNADGIRTASVIASTPVWARLRFDHVEQSPDLCASPALMAPHERRIVSFAPLVVGGGLVAARGRAGWGAFLGTGIQLWN